MGQGSWIEDKRWADRFLPEIKSLIGTHLIGDAPKDEDALRNTDLIVLGMRAIRIAVRIRKNEYLQQYGDQFTIRSSRPNEIETELTKIIKGWGDYFFYGFSDVEGIRLDKWFLADLTGQGTAYWQSNQPVLCQLLPLTV